MEETARLGLPYIMPAQAQKHVTHNEALRMLDAIIHIRVEDRARNDPPDEPAEGQRHALGAEPSGVFAGHAGALAAFQDGSWSFHRPHDGWVIWDAAEGALLVFEDGDWKPVLDPRNLPLLGVNAVADETNRLAVAADATLLTHDGAGHQLKLNKASPGDTGSLLFQTGWSGRAEMGLAGNDDFSIKTSPDGETWNTALAVDRTTGRLGFGVAAPQAVLHAKAPANGQTLFRFDDSDGNNLWRGLFDGANFHTYLGRRMFFNASASNVGMNFSGGEGIGGSQFRTLTSATDQAAGAAGLRICDSGESNASAVHPLGKATIAFRPKAWNGSNGFTLGSTAWFGLEQTAAANDQATFIWRLGSFGASNLMQLDHAGRLDVAGSFSAGGPVTVGSYTVATLPSAAGAGMGAIVFVSDETGGATLAFSDGSNWRRVADRAVVG